MTTERTQTLIDYFEPLIAIDKEEYTLWHEIHRAAAGEGEANGLRELPGYEDLNKSHRINKATKWLDTQAKYGEAGILRGLLVNRYGPLKTGPKGVKVATIQERAEMVDKKVQEGRGKLLAGETYIKASVAFDGYRIEPTEDTVRDAMSTLRRLLTAKVQTPKGESNE